MSKIHEVAEESGVSTSTVSRVFNKRPYVKKELRHKVLEIARKLEYSPKLTARKENIAIIVERLDKVDLGNYETLLINIISKHLIKSRLNFEIIPINEIDFVYQNFIQGAIAIVYEAESGKKIKQINGFPILTINCPIENLHSLYSDHKQGTQIAVKYLVEHGHKKIGIFLSDIGRWGNKQRLEGYKRSIKKFNLRFDEQLIQTEEKQSRFEAVAKILKAKPTSLIISGEDSALPVTYILNLLNQKIPDDISVISFENKSVSQYLTPPHTAISQHLEEIGEIAVKTIVEVIKGNREGTRNVRIKNSLIERESVKELMKKEAKNAVKSDEVVAKPKAVAISRSYSGLSRRNAVPLLPSLSFWW